MKLLKNLTLITFLIITQYAFTADEFGAYIPHDPTDPDIVALKLKLHEARTQRARNRIKCSLKPEAPSAASRKTATKTKAKTSRKSSKLKTKTATGLKKRAKKAIRGSGGAEKTTVLTKTELLIPNPKAQQFFFLSRDPAKPRA